MKNILLIFVIASFSCQPRLVELSGKEVPNWYLCISPAEVFKSSDYSKLADEYRAIQILSADLKLAITSEDPSAPHLEKRIKNISDSMAVHFEKLSKDILTKLVKTDAAGNYSIKVKPGGYYVSYEYADGIHCKYKTAE
jgi:hypothetical protein